MTTSIHQLIYGTEGHIPSELLERPITYIMGILIYEYVRANCTKVAFKVLLGQARAFSMFLSTVKATHCSMAFTREVQSMLWAAERDPKEKAEMDAHFRAVYKRMNSR